MSDTAPHDALVTPAQLLAFAPLAPANTMAPLIAEEAWQRSIATSLRLCHFMAQMAIECAYFRTFEENLSYSAARIAAVWPHRFTEASAEPYAHQPAKLANSVYSGRMGNGDEASGDGWRFRGRGPMMTTGRAEYAEAQKLTGLSLLTNPDLLLAPQFGVRDAAAYWAFHNINAAADRNDIEAVTRAVNGGLTDLGLRQQAFDRARKIWR